MAVTDTPTVRCPNCETAMRLVDRVEILFAPGLIDLVFVCPRCGAETKRTVKRDSGS
jgi:predicted nucleic acid-binding Zn ribbon protein